MLKGRLVGFVYTMTAAALLAVAAIAALALVSANILYTALVERPHFWPLQKLALSAALPVLKTGDLLLFDNSSSGIAFAAVAPSRFTHCGAVVVREGEVLVNETATQIPTAAGEMRDGTTETPLAYRLATYAGTVFVMRLNRPLDDPAYAAALATARPYPAAAAIVAATLTGRPRDAPHCFQHVAEALDVAGLYPSGERPLAERGLRAVMRAVADLPGKRLARRGFWYAPATQLVCDVCCVPPEVPFEAAWAAARASGLAPGSLATARAAGSFGAAYAQGLPPAPPRPRVVAVA
jgi:hypothetical protein